MTGAWHGALLGGRLVTRFTLGVGSGGDGSGSASSGAEPKAGATCDDHSTEDHDCLVKQRRQAASGRRRRR